MVIENFHIFGTMTVARQAAPCHLAGGEKPPRGPCCGSTENEPFFHGKNMELIIILSWEYHENSFFFQLKNELRK